MKPQVPKDFYKSLFESMLDGLAYCQMIFDAQKRPVDWIYLKVNKNFEKLTGLKDAVGKKVTELIPGITTSNPELFEIYGRVSLTGKSEGFETYLEPLSMWFSISVYSPKKGFFVALFQNITERKRIEKDLEDAKKAAQNVLEDLQVEKEKLAESIAKDKALLESIGDGVIATDQDGKVVVMNKAAEDLLGFTSEEIVGKYFAQTISLRDAEGNIIPDAQQPIKLALISGKATTTTTTTLVRKDGAKVPVAIIVTPFKLNDKIIGAITVFRDITKEKEIDKAKTEFVSLASHQLRTPLSTVSWYAEMLLAGDAGRLTDKGKKYLEEIYRSNRRMVGLVNALLSVSRIELGTFAIEPELVSLKEITEMCVKEMESEILKKELKLTIKYDPSLPKILADPKLLGMVCNNILGNSVKYTPVGGQVKLAVDKGESDIMITVSDTGLGIPKEAQSRIFEKLFRADNAREVDPDGTGLGLYIAKAILDHSGGRIWFESTENKGTTFYVAVPLSGMQAKKGTRGLN